MTLLKNFFGSKKGMIITGLVIGIFAALLQKLGNPANMGICVACMERDIAGALGFHRAEVVQYIRPEIIGFVLGSLIAALLFREFKSRGGSAPVVRFMLGFFAMVGALVFLGCPWRALLRLAGGDLNAILGIAGLAVGVGIGVGFIKSGYSLGANKKTFGFAGWILPIIMIALLILLLVFQGRDLEGRSLAPFFSKTGPGSMRAPILISLAIALVVGFLAQRSRFCTMGAVRDVILMKDMHLMIGVIALVIGAFATNLIFSQFKLGFDGQPISHTNHLWNFGGMLLSGLAFALAGGCPGRQLFLSGEGDGDAAIFVFGMIVGAGFAHNFGAASSGTGVGPWGPGSVIVGIIFCLIIGLTMRSKA
ncbi:MAG: YedE family putative selenium transporter [Candidatus Cloacimonas sp.]|nr:YedE-related selenium metabolism membrane protein [Candidatus Cloacimonadota bacterium]